MELLPLIYKALLYVSIGIVIILIFSYVTFKIKQKKLGNPKPHEKYQKPKTENKTSAAATSKVEKVERTEQIPVKTESKKISPEKVAAQPKDEPKISSNSRHPQKPANRVQRIERIVSEIEKHRPDNNYQFERESRRSVKPLKNDKRLEIIKPKKPSGEETKSVDKKTIDDKSKLKSLGDDVLDKYADDDDIKYSVKIDNKDSNNSDKS